jgi:hypothetical protein
MPVPPLHSVPLPVSLQQHPVEGTAAQQFVHNVPVDNKTSTNSGFQEPSVSAARSDGNKTFPNASASQLTSKIGLVEQPSSSSSGLQTVQASFSQAGVTSNEISTSAKVMVKTIPSNVSPGIGTGASNPNGQVSSMPSNCKTHHSSSSSDQQYQHLVNNQDRRTRATQKSGAGSEWQHRQGYMGRNQNSGSDKNSSTGRMKQIYVAKSSATSA